MQTQKKIYKEKDNALPNVSHLDGRRLVIKREPVDVAELLVSVINEQKSQIDEKKIVINKHFYEGVPILQTDSNLLRMVFQNLLSNAIKYTFPHGRVFIFVMATEDGRAVIIFSDTGYGIPKNDQGKVFHASNIEEKISGGTEGGLYIAKSFLSALHGSIRFVSEENKGTDFCITLPTREKWAGMN